jgi:hypothetical protein
MEAEGAAGANAKRKGVAPAGGQPGGPGTEKTPEKAEQQATDEAKKPAEM